ncbi:MAG TPA: dTMP kinase [Phototrophicaceae bacterium]|nr:dTMP kinase [Phototrophicaceae bacterium]
MFITFEGMDGSGKTTQVNLTAAALRDLGYNVLLTREPGGTQLGDKVRTLLLEKEAFTTPMDSRAELLLFCASRAQLVSEVIRPYLENDGIVICDRYIDSSIAYQGFGHGLDLDYLRHILDFATGSLYPDVTLYLDITPQEGLKRRAAASLFGEEFNRIDDMALEFHHRVYDGYTAIAEAYPERWVNINAAHPADKVQQAVMKILKTRLPATPGPEKSKGKGKGRKK